MHEIDNATHKLPLNLYLAEEVKSGNLSFPANSLRSLFLVYHLC
jgi:hypothetical protein